MDNKEDHFKNRLDEDYKYRNYCIVEGNALIYLFQYEGIDVTDLVVSKYLDGSTLYIDKLINLENSMSNEQKKLLSPNPIKNVQIVYVGLTGDTETVVRIINNSHPFDFTVGILH